jgi:integrase
MLTDTECKRTKPGAAPQRLADGGGLYLQIEPNGSRLWRLAYRFAGKQKTLALGAYLRAGNASPVVTLVMARERAAAAKRLIAEGQDPGAAKQEAKRDAAAKATFRDAAEHWLDLTMRARGQEKAPRTIKRQQWVLAMLYKELGSRRIAAISKADMLAVLDRKAKQGQHDAANRMLSTLRRVGNFACGRDPYGLAHNPANDIGDDQVVRPVSTKHPGLTDPAAVGQLMRAIDSYEGRDVFTSCALQFAALTLARPGMVNEAEWSEFDFDANVWTIPAAKMKMRNYNHMVPLARQAIAILAALRPITGQGRWVFSPRVKPMSSNTMNKALRKLGYDTRAAHCAHGFRTTASTTLHREVIRNKRAAFTGSMVELQLAHIDKTIRTVEGLYNEEIWLPERAAMLQHYADTLDALRAGATVIPLQKGAA